MQDETKRAVEIVLGMGFERVWGYDGDDDEEGDGDVEGM